MKTNPNIDIQIETTAALLPHPHLIESWVMSALQAHQPEGSLSIRFIDVPEMTELNERYRGKKGPTNVLSFPSQAPKELSNHYLGDILVCSPVIELEAASQEKSTIDHYAHMVVHGTLHLLGFDHQESSEAAIMEALEIKLLGQLGIPNPYKEIL